jgi:hypothetical protein
MIFQEAKRRPLYVLKHSRIALAARPARSRARAVARAVQPPVLAAADAAGYVDQVRADLLHVTGVVPSVPADAKSRVRA